MHGVSKLNVAFVIKVCLPAIAISLLGMIIQAVFYYTVSKYIHHSIHI